MLAFYHVFDNMLEVVYKMLPRATPCVPRFAPTHDCI